MLIFQFKWQLFLLLKLSYCLFQLLLLLSGSFLTNMKNLRRRKFKSKYFFILMKTYFMYLRLSLWNSLQGSYVNT